MGTHTVRVGDDGVVWRRSRAANSRKLGAKFAYIPRVQPRPYYVLSMRDERRYLVVRNVGSRAWCLPTRDWTKPHETDIGAFKTLGAAKGMCMFMNKMLYPELQPVEE